MDFLTFLTEITKALSWPLCLLIIVFSLRKSLINMLAKLDKIKYQDVELEFGKEIELLRRNTENDISVDSNSIQLPKTIIDIASNSPKTAVIESWIHVEQCVRRAAINAGIMVDDNLKKKPLHLSEMLLVSNIIDETAHILIKKLRILRNEAVHYKKAIIETDDAITYAILAEKACQILNK